MRLSVFVTFKAISRGGPLPASVVAGRSLSTTAAHLASKNAHEDQPSTTDETDKAAAYRRQRRTEWKRRRGGAFLDHLLITVNAGKGGDGCVAFHREKSKPFGPPSGGNGAVGGSVYVAPSHRLTSLAGVSKRISAGPGGNGQGTWQHGRTGEDYIIHVPYGTIVREVTDSRRAKDHWEAEEESYRDLGLSEEQIRVRRHEKRWVHYPEFQNDNIQRQEFLETVERFDKEDETRRFEETQRNTSPLFFEFEDAKDISEDEKRAKEQEELTRPLGLPRDKTKGILVARGGVGGYGNPHFLTPSNRSPKWATRGQDGECVTLEMELKLIADVGLVGFPNAGKSTLLNALTRRRAEVASYAFTTLNPQVGTVRIFQDGSFDGADEVIEDTRIRHERDLAGLRTGIEEDARQPRKSRSDNEVFRFTIADNPGLISDASKNVGLGHDFLRSIERARALAYVVDLNGERPWDELEILRDELEAYKAGLSSKCRIVIANKADLLVDHASEDLGVNGNPQEAGLKAQVEAAKNKLASLEYLVQERLGPLDVVAVSAKYNQNLRRVVKSLSSYVQDSRMQHEQHNSELEDIHGTGNHEIFVFL